MGFLGAKWGKGSCDVDHKRTRFYFWGFLRLCQLWWKLIKKCDCESAHRRTNWQTQTDFIICPMLHDKAMGQKTNHKKTCPAKTKSKLQNAGQLPSTTFGEKIKQAYAYNLRARHKIDKKLKYPTKTSRTAAHTNTHRKRSGQTVKSQLKGSLSINFPIYHLHPSTSTWISLPKTGKLTAWFSNCQHDTWNSRLLVTFIISHQKMKL